MHHNVLVNTLCWCLYNLKIMIYFLATIKCKLTIICIVLYLHVHSVYSVILDMFYFHKFHSHFLNNCKTLLKPAKSYQLILCTIKKFLIVQDNFHVQKRIFTKLEVSPNKTTP